MALEGPHVGRKQAKPDRASAVAVVDAVDQRRQFLAPVIVGREEIRLMLSSGNQVEQRDTDAQWFVLRDALPALLEQHFAKLCEDPANAELFKAAKRPEAVTTRGRARREPTRTTTIISRRAGRHRT